MRVYGCRAVGQQQYSHRTSVSIVCADVTGSGEELAQDDWTGAVGEREGKTSVSDWEGEGEPCDGKSPSSSPTAVSPEFPFTYY